VSIGFILICVVMYAGSFNMNAIVKAQEGAVSLAYWFPVLEGIPVLGMKINAYALNPLLFPMAVMFLISGMAETQRAPFDLTEAESELVAGYQTEYSSMSFALYWLGEYANVLLMCALNATLFWGGWLPPIEWAPLYWIPGWIWLFGKIFLFFFIFSWVKATVPRYRYDQLMRLGWKVFLPVSLLFVCVISGWLMFNRSHEGSNKADGLATSNMSFECQQAQTDYLKYNARRGSDISMVGEQVAPSKWKWAISGDPEWSGLVKGEVRNLSAPEFQSLQWKNSPHGDQFGYFDLSYTPTIGVLRGNVQIATFICRSSNPNA
jgi:NADH-quinone oxidoreductase subunit H